MTMCHWPQTVLEAIWNLFTTNNYSHMQIDISHKHMDIGRHSPRVPCYITNVYLTLFLFLVYMK